MKGQDILDVYRIKKEISEVMSRIYKEHCGIRTYWVREPVMLLEGPLYAYDYILSGKEPMEC